MELTTSDNNSTVDKPSAHWTFHQPNQILVRTSLMAKQFHWALTNLLKTPLFGPWTLSVLSQIPAKRLEQRSLVAPGLAVSP